MGASPADASAFNLLSSGTVPHHTVHVTYEEFAGGVVDLRNLIRFIPLDILTKFNSVGKILSAAQDRLSDYTILSELMIRAIRNYVRDFGLDTLRAAVLQAGGTKVSKIIEDKGDLANAIRLELSSKEIKPLRYGDGDDATLAALDRGTLADTGS